MLSSVLRSETAIEVNIRIMRVFTTMRRFLSANVQVFRRFGRSHDRFFCIDEEVCHIGASLKDETPYKRRNCR